MFSGGRSAFPTLAAFSPSSLSAVKYWLDARTIAGISDGSNITAASWTDQSASARGALATATSAIYRKTGTAVGQACVEFDGTASVCVSPAFTVSSPQRIFVVANCLASTPNNKYFFDGTSSNQGPLIFTNFAGARISAGLTFGASDVYSVEQSVWGMYDATFNGASSTLQLSGQLTKTNAGVGATGYAGVTLGAPGNLGGGFFANCQISEAIVCDSTLTASQAAQIRNYLMKKHGIVTRKLLICDGNSLTFGTSGDAGFDYPSQIVGMLQGGSAGWNTINNGQAGQTTPQMDTRATSFTDPLLNQFSRTVIIAFELINDIVNNSVSGATAAANFVTYCNNRRTAKADKIIAATAFPTANCTGANETARAAANVVLLATASPPWDIMIDIGSNPNLQSTTPGFYRAGDGTHLTDQGYALLASLFAPAVNSLG